MVASGPNGSILNLLCNSHIPFGATAALEPHIISQLAFPVPLPLDPIMEALDQPSLIRASFRHDALFEWKQKCLMFFSGIFTTPHRWNQSLSYHNAAKHVTYLLLEILMEYDGLQPCDRFHFSALFDTCFDLHLAPSIPDFPSLLTNTVYLFLAHCGVSHAYKHLDFLPPLEDFLCDANSLYPFCQVPVTSVLLPTTSATKPAFLARIRKCLHLVSHPDDLPHFVRPSFGIMMQTYQAFPLPPYVALLMSHACKPPRWWSDCFDKLHCRPLHLDWGKCRFLWLTKCNIYLYGLFSENWTTSDAPSNCEIAYEIIRLLLLSIAQTSQEETLPVPHFEDTFDVLHQRIPCTTFQSFSQLALETYTFIHMSFSCQVANFETYLQPSDDLETQLHTADLLWPC